MGRARRPACGLAREPASPAGSDRERRRRPRSRALRAAGAPARRTPRERAPPGTGSRRSRRCRRSRPHRHPDPPTDPRETAGRAVSPPRGTRDVRTATRLCSSIVIRSPFPVRRQPQPPGPRRSPGRRAPAPSTRRARTRRRPHRPTPRSFPRCAFGSPSTFPSVLSAREPDDNRTPEKRERVRRRTSSRFWSAGLPEADTRIDADFAPPRSQQSTTNAMRSSKTRTLRPRRRRTEASPASSAAPQHVRRAAYDAGLRHDGGRLRRPRGAPFTSFTGAPPAERLPRDARLGRVDRHGSPTSPSSTSRTRRSSSSTPTVRPRAGRLPPPTSTSTAPSARRRRACAIASAGTRAAAVEKLSGVTLTTPSPPDAASVARSMASSNARFGAYAARRLKSAESHP